VHFKDSVNELVPQLFRDLFAIADITYSRTDFSDNYDFLVVPQFVSANLFPDKVFGNDLLVYIQATFWSRSIMNNLVIKGTGKSSDDGIAAETPELGRQAFSAALNDLRNNILENRSLLSPGPQNMPSNG
jgi:hypothetical protein